MPEAAVFFSNDLTYLADCLAQQLFPPSAKPFERKLVIVPSQSTKTFIQRHWARNPHLGISAGVEFIEMPEALIMLSGGGKILPSSLELTLHLFYAASRMLEEKDRSLDGLLQYLDRNEDRLFPLCQQLARLFLDYGQHGEGKVDEWLQNGGWQAALWRAVFVEGPLTYPLAIFPNAALTTPFHLFGFSTMPAPYARFFKQRASTFYLFSPSAEFWGDYLSDGAHAKQALFWQKRGVKEEELASLDSYMQEQHPLLSNWGEAGRSLLEALQAEEMPGDEHYSKRDVVSRLGHLQRSILHLEIAPCTFGPEGSLQILSVPNRLREVETLLDAIKTLLLRHEKDENPLLPADILVLTPDINLYASYIHAVFGGVESQINYAIAGIERIRTSALAEALRLLLGLFEAKFDVQALLALFQSRPFREKQKWEEDDLEQIASWIEKSGITWGYDGAQRAQIAGSNGPLEERGTFCFGIDRLLFGLACREEDSLPAAIPELEWTDSDGFGKFVDIVTKLQRDVDYLASHEKRSLAEWTNWIGEIIERYFSADEDENWLHPALLRLTRICRTLEDPRLRFVEFCRIVDDILHRQSGHFGGSDLQVVRFASLAEGAILPAKAICLLGMEEGAFPRVESATSLCEMKMARPTRSACDRYLFLEACLKAQEYLRISYVSRSQDKSEQMPSFVVQELLEWLKKNDPHGAVISVPSLAISQEALEQFPYFSASRFMAAEYYYGMRHRPILDRRLPSELPPDLWPKDEEIRIEDLEKCLCNPLSFYFSRVLRFSFKWEELQDFATEEFCLSSRETLALAHESLFAPTDEVIERAKQRGEFPLGEFEAIARTKILKREEELRRQLGLFQVEPETCFTAVLSRCAREPKQLSKNRLLLPAWEIVFENQRYFVTGELKGISPQGLLCLAEDKAHELFPHWARYLILAGHPSLQSIPPALLPIDKETNHDNKRTWPAVDPHEEMGKLILYYQKAQSLPSPLLAKWLQDFFGPLEKLERKMSEETNVYAKWLVEQQGLAFTKALCDLWRPNLETTFASFLDPFEKRYETNV